MADANHTRMGDAVPRVDARLKVTGQAPFPSDMAVAHPAYAWLVTSAIARGRVRGFRLDGAKAVPGFLDILTFQTIAGSWTPSPNAGTRQTLTLESDQIQHDGQIIAVVVADTLEAAREAAHKVVVDYEAAANPTASFGDPGLDIQAVSAFRPDYHLPKKGDAEAAFAAAPVKVDVEYETAPQHHNQMELYTTTCEWQGGKLTVREPSGMVFNRSSAAAVLGIDPGNMHVISHFVGGHFGGKSSGTARTVLIAVASRRLGGRPVKLVPTRNNGFTIATYRAETRHHLQLAANPDGRIQAFIHRGTELTSRPVNYFTGGTHTTGIFYNYGSVLTEVSVARADRNTPGYMRSPAEVPYLYGLESAIDELAVALKMDPIEVRRINDTDRDPTTGRPFTSRSLIPCYDAAAKAFGWSRRNPEPRSMRDGDWLVGWGCATACYPSNIAAAAARITLWGDGRARVQIGSHEIGQGALTVMSQVAADRLGLDIADIRAECGDTDLPPGAAAAGSNGTATTGNAVAAACELIRDRLAQAAVASSDSPLKGADPKALKLTGKGLEGPGGVAEPLAKATGRVGGMVEVLGPFIPEGQPSDAVQKVSQGRLQFSGGAEGKSWVAYAHGANLVEVRIHARTGEIRVPRVVGRYAAGTLVNRRTAHSQLVGGAIWGIGSALHEATEIDRRHARYVNHNFADYLIPVSADVQALDLDFLPESETLFNGLGVKGIGELANVGLAAAIANAVYHATGKRLRRLPIRIEDLI